MEKRRTSEPEVSQISRFKEITRIYFEKLQRKERLRLFLFSLTITMWGIVCIGFFEYLFYLPAWLKLTTLISLPAISLVVAWYLKQEGEESQSFFSSFYNTFSKRYGIPELANAIDLSDQRNTSSSLLKSAIQQNIAKLDYQKVKGYLSDHIKSQPVTKSLRTSYGTLSVSALLLMGFVIFQPSVLERLSHPWKNYAPPNPYTYSVTPGSVTLEQGDSFRPSIHFGGEKPENLLFAFKTDIEEKYRTRLPAQTFKDSVTFSSLSLTTDGTYYFEMDGYKSELYRAEVQLLPRFESLSVTVTPPAYTGLDTTVYRYPFSKIRAYRGSEISLEGTANKPVSQLSLIVKQVSDTVALSHQNQKKYVHDFKLITQDTLSFAMRDEHGLSNKNSFEFIIEPVDDERPFVQFVRPETNLEMKNPESLELVYEASDDFGLTNARLHVEIQRAFKSEAEKQSIKLPIPSLNRSETFNWQVQDLDPKPRDLISYWIEVLDNDQANGPKKAQTRTLTITFPSLTSFVDELENRETNAREKLQDISDSYDQMKQEYDRFKDQLKENPQGNWEQKQSLEEVKKQQQAIDEKVKELNKEFEKIRRDIEKSDLLSEESRKAYQELQQLMEEIDDPELAKALEELQKALGNVNQEELRKALENYEFNEQQYQERLKRTVELFKTLKLNSDLDKMAKAFEQLSEEEKELFNSELHNSEEASKQEAIKKDLENLEQELQKLSENPPRKAKNQIEELQKKTGQELNSLKKELEENIDKLKDNSSSSLENSSQLKQQQQQIQKRLDKLAQDMRSAQQQLNQQRKQINIIALKYILHSLINLSQNQEELSQETESLSNRSQAFVEKARDEKQIQEQFTQIADSLFKVSSEIPSFSNSINKKKNTIQNNLESAVEQLAERNKSKATYAERQSLGGINELSTMIASLLNQLQNSQSQGGGGGGSMTMQQFMEKLKQMSGRQQQLNQQIQNYINDIQGDRLNQNQVDRLNQMARQQNEIRKQIEELQKKGGLETGDKVLSELERLSEEMEKTINDLRGGETNPPLIKRQQNILSRMLNAEKAIQERGKEEKREGTSAQDPPNNVSPDVTIEELQKKIRKLLNDPERTKFSEDYQRLIEQYFELLRDLQAKDDSTSIN